MPPRKRQVPLTPEPSGRRRSTRISLSGQTSRYFERDDDSDSDSDVEVRPGKRAKAAASTKGRNGARRQVDDSGDSDADSYKEEEEEQEGDGDEEEDKKEEDEDDSDSDAAPKITFIPHKKLHDLDGVDYTDETVHPVTMLFLKDLKANNRRDWLKGNDAEFRRAQKDWLAYVDTLGIRLASDADETIPELPAKDVVFRIYRDVRFSKDQRPYKPHFSAAWSRTGKKGPYACYYVHCEPGSCFVGGGLWHPENEALRLLRASIDERPQRWRRVLVEDEALRQTWLKGAAKGNEKAIKRAFAKVNANGALKKKPLGFSADHRDIELLKLRNFTMHKKIPDSVFTDADGQDQLISMLRTLVPFVTHLNRIVRPDPGDDSDSEEENGEEAEEEEESGEEEDGDEKEDEEIEDDELTIPLF